MVRLGEAGVIGLYMTDTVTRRRAVTTTDRYGNVVPGGFSDVEIPGCAVLPPGGQLAASTEYTVNSDLVTISRVLFAPHDSDIAATDQVLHGGRTYEVIGEPADFPGPLAHLEVNLKVVTG